MKISVLAYHAANIFGNSYQKSDNIALKQDLEMIQALGVKVISTHLLVDYISGTVSLNDNSDYVVITFDDGNNLDFIDSAYPDQGIQKSFFSVLKNSKQSVHATSFVIASPEARSIMEKTCLQGYPLLDDNWWQQAEDSGILSIENHSWDHVHPSLNCVKQQDNIKGDFSKINTFSDANIQINKSSEFIKNKLNNKNISLFAYPFGQYNSYLTDEYFPKQQSSIKAAFTCEPQHVTRATNLWKIPRFICGCDWKSPQQFKKIVFTEVDHAKT